MQILLGAHETLVRFTKTREHVFHIEAFIEKHFFNKIVDDHSIVLSYHANEHYNRLFLLKWLYSIYKNKTEHTPPEFRSILAQRVEKPIRIVFQNQKAEKPKLHLFAENQTQLRLEIKPFSFFVYCGIKNALQEFFSDVCYDGSGFVLDRYDPQVKAALIQMLHTERFLGHAFHRTFSQETIDGLCSTDEKPPSCDVEEHDTLSQAYVILNVARNQPIHEIKAQYRSLAQQYHPDKNYHKPDENIEAYTKKFQLIQYAYELIRSEYKKR